MCKEHKVIVTVNDITASEIHNLLKHDGIDPISIYDVEVREYDRDD